MNPDESGGSGAALATTACAGRGRGAGGAFLFLRGRFLLPGGVRLALAGGIAVRIPSPTFQVKGAHGYQFLHLASSLGALRHRGILDALSFFKDSAAMETFILVYRHSTPRSAGG